MVTQEILKRTHGIATQPSVSEKTPKASWKEPFVVSSDLFGLMQAWSTESGYKVPSKRFFDNLTKKLKKELHSVFEGRVDVISEERLRRGMNRLARRSHQPILSLDRAYVNDQTPNVIGYVDLTRLVDENQEKIGLGGRDGKTTIEEEVGKHSIEGLVQPVTLIDDVIFGGDTNVVIAEALERVGRPVPEMIAGVTIREGGDKLRAMGVKLRSVKEYKKVVDEVCERDFFAGVPYSGKTMKMPNGSVTSVPYFEPFARSDKLKGYTSIGSDKAKSFSEFCLDQSIHLWEEVERVNGRPIPAKDVPRPLYGIPDKMSIVDGLRYNASLYRRRVAA